MRNDVLQNYLDQFCKFLADNFDNLKFQDAPAKLQFLDHQIVTSCIVIDLKWPFYSLFERK